MPTRDELLARRRAKYAANLERERARNRAVYAAKKEDRKARSAAYRQAHPEQAKQATARWRAEKSDAIREKRAMDYAANPEYFREKSRRYWQSHPEEGKAKNAARDKAAMVRAARRWQLANPERSHAINARRRAREANAPINDFTGAQWREMKAAYDHRCVYCGRKMKRLTQDHITPLFYGGSHTAANIVPACISCNSQKHIGPPLQPVQPLLLLCAPGRTA